MSCLSGEKVEFDATYNKIYLELSDFIFNKLIVSIPHKQHYDLYKQIKKSEKIKVITDYINLYVKDMSKAKSYSVYHIRRGDATAVENKYADKYRISSIYSFAKLINESKTENNIIISDDFDYCRRFLDILCPNKYQIINDVNLNQNTKYNEPKNGTILDVIDFFLFENCERIYGTNWSSFCLIGSLVFDKKHSYVIDENKYGLLVYDKSVNIGDYIQSIAIKQYLPYVNYYVDRDSLSEFTEDHIKLVLFGWFMHTENCFQVENKKVLKYCVCGEDDVENKNKLKFPPHSENIDSFIISLNISNDKLLGNEDNIKYLKQHEPIGARDLDTNMKLHKHHIQSYFSGCATLTLPKKENIDKIKGQVLVVDVPEKYVDMRTKKKYNCIYKSNTFAISEFFEMSEEDKFKKAQEMLDLIQSSEKVITSRLHVMSPCLALDVPVQFVGIDHSSVEKSKRQNPEYSKSRYSGIKELIDNPKNLKDVQKKFEYDIITGIYKNFYIK
jgi:hypothetical protein